MQPVSKLLENRYLRIAFLGLLAVLAAISVVQGLKNAVSYSQDFQWDAAKALCMGLDPYELSGDPQKALEYPELEAFYRFYTDRDLKQKMEANQFPSLLLLLAPMTIFGPDAARIVWAVLNAAFTAGIIILLRKTFFAGADAYGYAVISLIMLAGTPYRNQLGVGQHTLFSFFFFMLAVWFEKREQNKKPSAGIFMTLCLFVSYFKYTLTAPLTLYFLYRKRYKEIVLSVAGHIVLTEVLALYLGKSFIYMITAPLQVASALASEGGLDLGVWLGTVPAFAVAAVISVMLVILACLLPEDMDNIFFPVLILWSLLIVYHRIYDYFAVSAVAMMFFGSFGVYFGKRCEKIFTVWYWIVIAALYFVLRIFNENAPSMIMTGVVFYGFTVCLTYILIRSVFIRRKAKERNFGQS